MAQEQGQGLKPCRLDGARASKGWGWQPNAELSLGQQGYPLLAWGTTFLRLHLTPVACPSGLGAGG